MIRRSMLLSICVLVAALPTLGSAQRPEIEPVRVDGIAEKLGLKLMPSTPRELAGGQSATASLAEPLKVAPYGITGVHEGARVTITCVGPNRLRVEADEYVPVERRVTVTLRVAEDGSLEQVPERQPPVKPPIG